MQVTLMRSYILSVFILFTLCGNVFANEPKPLGFELGKTTLEEFKQKYPRAEEKGISKYYRGAIFYCSPTFVALEGLKEAWFTFNHNNILSQIKLVFPHEKYHILNKQFAEKYTLIHEKKGPQAWIFNYTFGEENAFYKQGNVRIEIETDSRTDKDSDPCQLSYMLLDDQAVVQSESKLSDL